MKVPTTPAEIEPATFRFVAQHLNHCTTAIPVHLGTDLKYYFFVYDVPLWCMNSENGMQTGNHNYMCVSFIAGCVFRHMWRAIIGLNNF